MTEPQQTPPGQPNVRRRRLILYAAALAALLVVAAFGASTLLSGGDDEPKKARLATPLIVERFELKPVAGASGRGIAELLTRPTGTGLRVLAQDLKRSSAKQVYQLVLAGGTAGEKLLGNEVVGRTGLFVGEAKVSVDELHQHKRIELRLITQGDPPTEKTILRGSIPD